MSSSPEDKIKKLGVKLGANLVGIASVEDINRYAPEGHRPERKSQGESRPLRARERVPPGRDGT